VPTVPVLETPTVQQEPLPGRALPRVSDDVSAASFGGGVAQGLSAVGGAASEQQAKLKQQNDHTRVIDANTQLEAARDAMLFGPNGKGGGAYSLRGMDAINMPDRYLPQYDKVAAGIGASLTADQKRLFGDHVANGRAALNTELNRYEYGQSNQLADTVYANATKQAVSSAALNWRDPDKVNKSRADLGALVQLQGDREGWDATTRQQTLKDAMGTMHQNVVEEMSAEGNTAAARTYLFGASAKGEIEPKAADSMLRMLNAQEEHKIAMDDKIQRDASNSLLKNAILMQSKGQLSASWIEQHHQTWEPPAYEYAYKLLAGKENETDAHVFAPLLVRSMNGEDVTSEAQSELYAGHLKQEDFTRLVEKTEAPRGNFVKNGANYIEQALKPSPLLYKPDAALDYANALDDFHIWVHDNPKATPEDGMKMARTISQNYALVQADKAIVFGPVPSHLVGSRMQPNIPQTWAATKVAHDAGQMSDAEFQRQATLLQQWNAAAETKANAPKAKP